MKDRQRVDHPLKFEVLPKNDRERIYSAALEVLERTGIKIREQEALFLLKEAGGQVEKDVVHIPSRLVEEALRTAPKEISIYSRDGQPAMLLNTRNSYFGNGSDCVYILDSFTGERRKFTKEDVEKAAIICDALPNINFVMPAGIISDKPAVVAGLHAFQATTFNTPKPILFTALNRQGAENIIKVASIVAEGEDELCRKPFIMHYVETTSPLSYSTDAAKMLLLSAEKGIPIVCAPGPIGGASAPVTLAGILVLHLAECLSEVVIAELKSEGVPVILGGCASIMDMKSAVSAYGGPEFYLLNAALSELCHFLNLPMFGTAGCSDAKMVDGQAAIESATSCVTQALSNANLIHDMGYIDSGLTTSFDMLVTTDEIVGMTKRIVDGVNTDADRLAVDLIGKVGPGGNYLAEPHTLKYFKDEHWMPKLIDRRNYEGWVKSGSRSFEERANKKVKSILDRHGVVSLEESKKEEILSLIKSREAEA